MDEEILSANALTIGLDRLAPGGRETEFRSFMASIFAAATTLQVLRRMVARQFDLSAAELAVILEISRFRYRPSIRELAQRLSVAASNVTADVGALAKRGLVLKRRDEEDVRALKIALTAKGERLVANLIPALRHVNDNIFATMTRDDMVLMTGTLQEVVKVGRRLVTDGTPANSSDGYRLSQGINVDASDVGGDVDGMTVRDYRLK